MNTFQDLNVLGNTAVTYANAAAYTIAFGANAGNVTQLIATTPTTEITLSKQVDITVLDDAYQDVLIQLVANVSSPIANIQYRGSFANIWVQQHNAVTWTVRGIRDITRYDEAWANVTVRTSPTADQDFEFAVTVNDQSGNIRSWTEILDLTEFTVPAAITFDEDTPANITGISVNDLTDSTFTVTVAVTDPALAQIRRSGNLANSVTITDSRANINAEFAANTIQLIPAADSTTPTVLTYTQLRNSDQLQANAVPIQVTPAGSHADFQVPVLITTDEDTRVNLTGVAITDLRPDRVNASTQYAVQVAVQDPVTGSIWRSGNLATAVTLTGTKSTVNSEFSNGNIRFQPAADYVGAAVISYEQTQTTDGIVQAAVSIPVTVGNAHVDFQVPAEITLDEDTRANVAGVAILDLRPDRIDSDIQYTISFEPQSNGVMRYANTAHANLVLTNTKANLNSILSANSVQFEPAPDFSGTTTILYNQRQITDGVQQAATVAINTVVSPSAEFAAPVSILFDEDTRANIAGVEILDARGTLYPDTQYTISFEPTVGNLIYYNGTTYANLVLTNTKATLNSILSANAVQFEPAADFAGNVAVTYRQRRDSDGIQQANTVITMVGTPSAEFTAPASIVFNEDTRAPITTIQITDNRGVLYPGTEYSISIAVDDTALGLIRYQGNNTANLALTGTRSALNAILTSGNIQFEPAADFAGNTGIRYQQTQTTDGIQQANVVVPVTVTPQVDHQLILTGSNTVFAGSDLALAFLNGTITDSRPDIYPNLQYTISFQPVVGEMDFEFPGTPPNTAFFGDVAVQKSNGVVTFTGSRGNLNSLGAFGSIVYRANSQFFGNTQILYSQQQITDGTTQAANVPIDIQCPELWVNADLDRTYFGNRFHRAFDSNSPAITSTDGATPYQITISTPAAVLLGDTIANTQAGSNVLVIQDRGDNVASRLATVYFAPQRDQPQSTSTLSLTANRLAEPGGAVLATQTVTANLIFENATVDRVIAATQTQSVTITDSETYYGNFVITAVGGGGGGSLNGWTPELQSLEHPDANSRIYANSGGSGGGGGNVVVGEWSRLLPLPSGQYNITVGQGGAGAQPGQVNGNYFAGPGNSGGNTSIALASNNFVYLTAEGGGGGGQDSPRHNDGGASANYPGVVNTDDYGGNIVLPLTERKLTQYGSGGSGAGGSGTAPFVRQSQRPGIGGPGVSAMNSDGTGNITYGGGGGGAGAGPALGENPTDAGFGQDGGGNARSNGQNGRGGGGGGGGANFSNTAFENGGRGGDGILIIKIS